MMVMAMSTSATPLAEAAGPATRELVGAAAAAELLEPATAAADMPAASAEAAIRLAAATCAARLRARRICGMAARRSMTIIITLAAANLSRNGYEGVRSLLGLPDGACLPCLRGDDCLLLLCYYYLLFICLI